MGLTTDAELTIETIESAPPQMAQRVVTTLDGLTSSPVRELLDRFPHIVDAMERSGLHLLEGSWMWSPDNELAPFLFTRDPDPAPLLAALRPALARRVLEAILRARRHGKLPSGALDVGRVGVVGEVGYTAARMLSTHLTVIEPPEDGPAHGWSRPLPVLGWLGAGEGGSWYFGIDGKQVVPGRWEAACAAADAWIAQAGGAA